MSRRLLALLLLVAGVPGAQGRDALGVLDACIGTLDRGLDIGYARIAARCPDLTPSLLESPWAPWLPADWNKPDNQLSAQGLSELRELLARESGAAAAGRHLRTERVGGVLAGIAKSEPAGGGWWVRFKQWLRELLTQRPQQEQGWWRRLFGDVQLEQGVLRSLVWGSLALVVVLAVVVILNELRVAGLLRQRGSQRRTLASAAARAGLSLGEIEHASPGAQPALLLEFIAARLAEQDRLPPARAFTARELTRRARLQRESDRLRLGELAGVCERMRFSGQDVAPQVVAGAMAQGRELLNALEAPAAAASGAG